MNTGIESIKTFLIETLQRKSCISLYANYIVRIEENFIKQKLPNKLAEFIKDYLSIYTENEIPTEKDAYICFRDFYENSARLKSDENILKHIFRYSNYYLKFLTEDFQDIELKNLIHNINEANARDVYPYLMEIFEDFEFAHINKTAFFDTLETVEKYAVNRHGNHKKAVPFNTLCNEIDKMLNSKHSQQEVNDNMTNHSKTLEPLLIQELLKQN